MNDRSGERREGSLEAPTRHPIPWQEAEFYDQAALEHELDPLLLHFQHEQLLRHYLETDFQVERDLKQCLRRFQAALWLRAAPSHRSSSALFDETDEPKTALEAK